jgi:hypothetical protein
LIVPSDSAVQVLRGPALIFEDTAPLTTQLDPSYLYGLESALESFQKAFYGLTEISLTSVHSFVQELDGFLKTKPELLTM